jgi:hypothetical protein
VQSSVSSSSSSSFKGGGNGGGRLPSVGSDDGAYETSVFGTGARDRGIGGRFSEAPQDATPRDGAWAAEGLTAEQAMLKRFQSAFEWMVRQLPSVAILLAWVRSLVSGFHIRLLLFGRPPCLFVLVFFLLISRLHMCVAQASALESADANHAAALADAVSCERQIAAQAAAQAASVAQRAREQAREQAQREAQQAAQAWAAGAVAAAQAAAAAEVAELRDQHDKVSSWICGCIQKK